MKDTRTLEQVQENICWNIFEQIAGTILTARDRADVDKARQALIQCSELTEQHPNQDILDELNYCWYFNRDVIWVQDNIENLLRYERGLMNAHRTHPITSTDTFDAVSEALFYACELET